MIKPHSVLMGALVWGASAGCSEANPAGANADSGAVDSTDLAPTSPMPVVPTTVGQGNGSEQPTVAPTPVEPTPGTATATAGVAPTEEPANPAPSEPSGAPEPGNALPGDLPPINGDCPALSNGTVEVAGSEVRLWVGSTPGPVYFYFHGTGSSPTEVDRGLPGATEAVTADGGLVASFAATNRRGTNTGNGVWYTGDFEAADQILACAMEEGLVDARRIHAAGYSAGGLQTGAMVFARSSYLASSIVYSGGKGLGAGSLQDPDHVPPTLFAHGAAGSDVLVLDFAQRSMAMGTELLQLGGFSVDCNDGGGHVALSRLGVQGAALEFLAAHPFGTSPSPYAAGLPAIFPEFCQVAQ